MYDVLAKCVVIYFIGCSKSKYKRSCYLLNQLYKVHLKQNIYFLEREGGEGERERERERERGGGERGGRGGREREWVSQS